jgi:hypothetical protein
MPTYPQYGGGYYRGGGAGVQSDLGLRDRYAGAAADLYGQGQLNRQNAWNQNQNNYQNAANNLYGQGQLNNQNAWNQNQNNYSGAAANMIAQAQGSYNNAYNNIGTMAAGMATSGQINRARADLMPTYQGYQNLYNNGMYSGQQMSDILQDAYQQVGNSTRAMQGNANAMNASRGLGANAGMTMATGLAGQFAAAGARGQANAGLQREQAQSKIHGLDGMGNIGGQLADYAARPTQEGALAMRGQLKSDVDLSQLRGVRDEFRSANQPDLSGLQGIRDSFRQSPDVDAKGLMDLYEQYRNATIGQQGANEFARERPGAPSYPQSYPNGYTPPAGPIQTGGGYSYGGGGGRPGGMPGPYGGSMGMFSAGGGMPMPSMGGAPTMGGAPGFGGGMYTSPGAGGAYNPYVGAPDRSTGQPINPATGMPYVAINPKTGRPYGPGRNVQVTALGDNTYAPKPTGGGMTHVWPPRRTF